MKKNTALILLTAACLLAFAGISSRHTTRLLQEGTITNLYDAFGLDTTLQKDFGFSCILRHAGKTILFDAGGNADMFKHNVERLGIDLLRIDAVVVSHGHFDHLNGLDYVLQVNPSVRVYMPYDIFWGAPVPFDATGPDSTAAADLPRHMRYFDGGPTRFMIPQSGRFWGANVEYVKSVKEIFPGMRLIATNSPYMGYFSGYPNKSFVEGQFEDAEHSQYKYTNLPEISLTLQTEKGQVLIVGCSHSGVERIIEETKKVTGDRIDLVCGGFHLIPFGHDKIGEIGRYLKNDLGVRRIAPAHCTGHLAFKVLSEQYGPEYLYAGLGETIRF
ncbi:MAG: MBL fold metallo-hydrolase [Saprospirales bacterium]|nr:MBL fold metallo-hydrolase [Saprospirales bacterium]